MGQRAWVVGVRGKASTYRKVLAGTKLGAMIKYINESPQVEPQKLYLKGVK